MIVDACDKKILTASSPYHVFVKLGQFFVFDTSAYRFYKIDEITYRFLKLCLDRSIEEAEQILSKEGRFAVEEIHRVAEEVRSLAQNGLFDVPDFSTTETLGL